MSSEAAAMTAYSVYMQHAIIVYDLETTGLNTSTAEIVELAAAIDPGCKQAFHGYFRGQRNWGPLPVVADSFSTLVLPESGAIPAAASRVNGIYIEDLIGKPPFPEVAKQFMEWLQGWRKWCPPECKGIVLVAHNNFKYDAHVLLRQMKQHGLELPDYVSLGDSLVAFRECFPGNCRRFNLQAITDEWVPKEKQVKQDHRAASDVKMLLMAMYECPDPQTLLETMVRRQRVLR